MGAPVPADLAALAPVGDRTGDWWGLLDALSRPEGAAERVQQGASPAQRTAAPDVPEPDVALYAGDHWPSAPSTDPWPELPDFTSAPPIVPAQLERDLARAERLAREQAAV